MTAAQVGAAAAVGAVEPAALSASGLCVSFGGVRAVDGVTLAFDRGTVCGLIGPNGAGKTTFFDALSGVTTPTRGTVRLGGVDVTRRSATWRARRGLRRTFQRQQMFGWLSVEDNVLVAIDWHGGGGGILGDTVRAPGRRRRERTRRERVAEVLEVCGLSDVRHTIAGTLPIGTARFVELARAIADGPGALLLDEPTSGLGPAEVERFGAILARVQDDADTAIVLVEHDVPFVMRHCDRVVVLHLGSVLADGTPADVQADAAVADAYLG